jgi:hypothetical protein
MPLKLLIDYLDRALAFERMAAQEIDLEVKAQFQKQACAYRDLAAAQAAKCGLPAPSPPDDIAD